jgi:hypothetical protein
VDGKLDAIQAVTDKMDDTLEDNGGTYRFTANALEQAPAGEGGGTNITQIKGEDATDVLDARIAAQLAAYDPPTRAELTSDKEAILAAISGLNDLSMEDIRDMVVETEGNVTLACYMAAMGAVMAGQSTTVGNQTNFRDPSGTAVRVTATVTSAGNRTMTITCPSYE